MVSRRCSDHAFGELLFAEAEHLVVGPAQLEGKHRLQIFPFQQYPVTETLGQLCGLIYRGFHHQIIDTGI